MPQKKFKEWRKQKKHQTNEIYSPISMTTAFFVYTLVFTIFLSTLPIPFISHEQTNGVYAEICVLSRASKYDANNPTYLVDLSTFVTIISFVQAAFLYITLALKRMKQRSMEIQKKKLNRKKLFGKSSYHVLSDWRYAVCYTIAESFCWLPDVYIYMSVFVTIFVGV